MLLNGNKRGNILYVWNLHMWICRLDYVNTISCSRPSSQFISLQMCFSKVLSLRWRHNGCDSISNHQPHHCLLNRLFRRRSKKTSKLRVTGLCAGNSPGTGELPAQMASYAENVSIWWRHHVMLVASGSWDVPNTTRPPNDRTPNIFHIMD